MQNIIYIILGLIFFVWSFFAYIKSKRLRAIILKDSEALEKVKKEMIVREGTMNRKMYELAILKELGDRIGYSLDVHQIIDIITGSLHQFIEYSAVSYMLLEPEKLIFKVHLEKSVHENL